MRRLQLAGVALSDARLVFAGASSLATLIGGFGERPSKGLRQHRSQVPELIAGTAEWQPLPAAFASDRGGHAVDALSENLIIMHGGYGHGTQQGNLADVWAASNLADDNTPPRWRQLSPEGTAPSARAGHTLTAVSTTELVLFGGFGQQGFEDVHILRVDSDDGESSSWRELVVTGDTPGPRCAHAAAALPCSEGTRRRLITFGGYTASHGADAALSLLTISENGDAGCWEPLHAAEPDDGLSTPLQRSGHSAAVASGERLLVFGGTCDDLRTGGTHVLGDALCLDVSDEGLERLRHPDGGARWQRLEIDADEEELARYNHAAALAVHGDEAILLVVGGTDESHMPMETAFALVVPPGE